MKNAVKVILCLTVFSIFVSCQSDDFPFLTDVEIPEEITIKEKTKNEILTPEQTEEIEFSSTQIEIKTDIPKANIYLNNIYQGKSPLKINNAIAGYYLLTVEFVKQDGMILKETYMIEVEQGKRKKYYIKMPLENSIN